METKVSLRTIDQYGGYLPPERLREIAERAAQRVWHNAEAYGVKWSDGIGWKRVAWDVAERL